MTILIKGMEMPVTCCQCKEMVYNPEIKWEQAGKEEEGGWVCLLTGELIDNTKREEHCPLIEVPTPHGRLVDAYEAVMLLQKYYDRIGEPLKEHAIGECIMIIKDDVPTIIEAEEVEG